MKGYLSWLTTGWETSGKREGNVALEFICVQTG